MSTSAYVMFMLLCGALMATGFASIIMMAGELVTRETFEEKNDE